MNAQIQMLFLMIAGWVNRHQQAIIEYLQEENRILLDQLGGKPRRFTDAQRIRLAQGQAARPSQASGSGHHRHSGHTLALVSDAGRPQVDLPQEGRSG
jgi:hypothetical protein